MGAHAIAWDATEGEAGRMLHDKERARAVDMTDRVTAPLPPLTAPEQTIDDAGGVACLEVCEGVAMALELLVRSDSELWDEHTRPPFNPHTVAAFSEHHPLGPWHFVDVEHKDDERYVPAWPVPVPCDAPDRPAQQRRLHSHHSRVRYRPLPVPVARSSPGADPRRRSADYAHTAPPPRVRLHVSTCPTAVDSRYLTDFCIDIFADLFVLVAKLTVGLSASTRCHSASQRSHDVQTTII